MMDVYFLPGKPYGKRRAISLLWQPGCSQNSCILKSSYSCQFMAVPGFLMFTSLLKVRGYLIFVLICISLITSETKHLIKCCYILYFFFTLLIHILCPFFYWGCSFFPIDLYRFWVDCRILGYVCVYSISSCNS